MGGAEAQSGPGRPGSHALPLQRLEGMALVLVSKGTRVLTHQSHVLTELQYHLRDVVFNVTSK